MKTSRFYVEMKKFFSLPAHTFFSLPRVPFLVVTFKTWIQKNNLKIPQKDHWNSYQLFKISQPNAKNWIFRNLPGIDLYPAGTLGPLGVKHDASPLYTNF